MTSAAFPALRLRRTRMTDWSRRLHAETRLSPADLIWPLFVAEGDRAGSAVASLPGVSRWSIADLVERAREAEGLGIPAIALFPDTPPDKRSDDAREALSPDCLVARAIAEVKARVPGIGVIADVALDPYTSHGHDGVLDASGEVANDRTVAILIEQAALLAAAGADVVAPSDMMDGRVAAIRAGLEADGAAHVQIMAYAAKYASAFYGPFRDAVGSGKRLAGSKASYQMDPANGREALREVALDIAEGADSVIVKPGLPYLDIVAAVAERFAVPVFAYAVSGEYAMIEAAAAAGAGNRDAMLVETLTAFRRAGATGVLTYHAPVAARLIAR